MAPSNPALELWQIFQIIRCSSIPVGANVLYAIDSNDVNVLASAPFAIISLYDGDKSLASL